MGVVLATFLYLLRPTGSSTGDYSRSGQGPASQVAVVVSDLDPMGKYELARRNGTPLPTCKARYRKGKK